MLKNDWKGDGNELGVGKELKKERGEKMKKIKKRKDQHFNAGLFGLLYIVKSECIRHFFVRNGIATLSKRNDFFLYIYDSTYYFKKQYGN